MEYCDLDKKEKVEEKQIKSNDKFAELKNDYFLQKLFNNLKWKKTLTILKFNKSLKKRMNMNINDYKEYSENYSSIEIEIKPVNNEKGKFINFEFDEEYYHIYFNNNEEETKRNRIKEGEHITIIKIIIDYQVKSFEKLFHMCNCIESIYFKKFYRNNITSMHDMFFECESLKELNLDNFNTSNVIDMSWMFKGCSSLEELNLNNFNTNKVTDMSYMFFECKSLKKINFNNFNFNNAINMHAMFYWCKSLRELNINNFDINNTIDMNDMFPHCPKEFIMNLKSQYQNKIEK